jgi:hypothetical protein
VPRIDIDQMHSLEFEALAAMNRHHGDGIETIGFRRRYAELPVITDTQPASKPSDEATHGLVCAAPLWNAQIVDELPQR